VPEGNGYRWDSSEQLSPEAPLKKFSAKFWPQKWVKDGEGTKFRFGTVTPILPG